MLVSARVQAQSLDAAEELYASAEYESALAMLDGLKTLERPREEQQTIELYRVLCLVATGKEADAKGIMEGLVARNPLFRPSTDLPPRVRSTYSETRKRMLPSAAQSAYQEAKAAFDYQGLPAPRNAALLWSSHVLADPDVEAQATQVTALGHPHAGDRVPRTERQGCGSAAAGCARRFRRRPWFPSCRPPPPRAAKVYSVERPERRATDRPESADSMPSAVRFARPQTGVIEVLIDTMGGVESAVDGRPRSIRSTTGRRLAQRRLWQYQPARVDGAPVKFVKRIQVNLVPGGN